MKLQSLCLVFLFSCNSELENIDFRKYNKEEIEFKNKIEKLAEKNYNWKSSLDLASLEIEETDILDFFNKPKYTKDCHGTYPVEKCCNPTSKFLPNWITCCSNNNGELSCSYEKIKKLDDPKPNSPLL